MCFIVLSCSCVHSCESFQLCQTLGDSMDCGWPGSSVHEISQARVLKWVTMPSSRDLLTQGLRGSLTSTCIGKWVLYPSATSKAHLAFSLSYFVSFMNQGNIKTYFQLFIPFLAQVIHKLPTFNYFLI